MDRNYYYVGIAFFGMINGLFNQALVPFAYLFAKVLAPGLLFGNESLTLLFASLMALRALHRRDRGFDRRFAVDLARRYRAADAAGDRQFLSDRALARRMARTRL
jgi:hypothetical protein